MINFELLSIPAPFLSGPVNVYLIKNNPVTLIDCGPNCPETKVALIEQLSSHGLGLEDIKQIIITHGHSDHYGLAVEIQRVSGAAIYVHNKEIPKILYRPKFEQNVISYLAYAGMPEVHCKKQKEYFSSQIVVPPEEITGVEDGHIFNFEGCQLEVIYTSGHSLGHISLYQRKEGLLFSGDAILENVRQKPLVEPLPEQPLQREKSIMQYIDSLTYIKKQKISRILPGHGKPVFDVEAVLREIKANLQRRKEEFDRIAAGLKLFTPFDLVSEKYNSDYNKSLEVCMALSESLGYLDLLEAEGKVMQLQNTVPLTYNYL